MANWSIWKTNRLIVKQTIRTRYSNKTNWLTNPRQIVRFKWTIVQESIENLKWSHGQV